MYFTIEEESEGRIPFLDAVVERRGSHVRMSVYCKPTNTDRYIHFGPHHHRKVIRGMLYSMRERAHKLCTDKTRTQELSHLTKVFNNSGYLRPFID